MPDPQQTYRYRIDPDNVVVDVGGDWAKFCRDNDGDAACLPEQLIGTPLRNCISDSATWSLYEMLIDSVRRRQRSLTLPVRCDSPAERRFCDLRIHPSGGGHMDFESRLLRCEPRAPVPLLEADAPRDRYRYLKVCSVCKRAEVAPGEWLELEDAEQRLHLFARERLPRVTHGLCTDCFERGIQAL